jgi:hypothetical protein
MTGQLIRFLMPLVVTMVVQEFGLQVLNGGMARVPQATETLASFGLAWGLVSFLVSPLSQVKQLGLVLVDSQQSLGTVLRFVLLSGLLLAGILLGLALTPVGNWVVEDLHDMQAPLSQATLDVLFWLFPIPLLRGLTLFYAGVLLRFRRTDWVSVAMLAGMAANIVAVFALLPTGLVQAEPMWLPILVTYAGVVAEWGVVFLGYRRHGTRLPRHSTARMAYRYVLHFFWPLALIMAIQGFSRPLINLFVSREPGGAEALAVLTVLYPLGHLPYGWLNEIRNLPPAFRDQDGSLPAIRRFSLACGLLSFAIMVGLSWTPLRDVILLNWIGIEPALAVQATAPLVVFSFFPLAVMLRAYLHGVGLVEHRTQALAPSAPLRLLAILVALLALPALGVQGATRGVAALFCGFVCETAVVWWGVRGRDAFRRWRLGAEARP